jgi:DNA-binding NtrC family response regulator
MQLTGTTLLVIDNDDAFRRDIVIRLQNCGFDVLQADSAVDGLQQFSSQRPELVLCALHLPESDGFASLMRAVSSVPDSTIVVIAPSTDMSRVVEALRTGAHDDQAHA